MEWQEWRRKCDTARDKLVERVKNHEKPEVTDLYKDPRMQDVYKSQTAPFYGKCVYCESHITVNHPGDIEHWRPKNSVTDETGRVIEIDTTNGKKTPHPGYYWLAYEWRNLLFACIDCNRPSKSRTQGQLTGKRDQFPVKDFRATKMGEESQETPILINPVEEDPANHLEVDDTGIMIAKTDRGKMCINVFGLNIREALRDARRKYIDDTRWLIKLLIWRIESRQSDEADAMRKLAEKVKEIKSGAAPFSACGRFVLREFEKKL